MVEWVTIGRARETRIYALCEFPSMKPRYVGLTTQSLWERLKGHNRQRIRTPKRAVCKWLNKIAREKRDMTIKLLEIVPANGDPSAREIAWMERLGRDNRLLNGTTGGERGDLTKAIRDKISAKLRTGADFDCQECGASFYRKLSDIDEGNNKFCSRPCYAKSLAGVSRPVPAAFSERGIAAAAKARRAQTDCKRGHPLSGDNLFLTTQGSRGCKACRKLHKKTYLEKARG